MPETELKFVLDDTSAALLQTGIAALEGAAPAVRHALHAIYFDTRGHRLKKAGVALRIRREDGRWVQTLKARADNGTGLQRAEEAEIALETPELDLEAIPDKALRKLVRGLVGDRTLRPVCETVMERLTVLVRPADGTVVEVSLDQGRIIAGAAEVPFLELELELKSGPVAALYDLAGALLGDGRMTPSRLSKSARGYLLAATGQIAPPAAPRKAADVALDPGMSAGQAGRAIFAEIAAQVLDNIDAVLAGDDPEGPHQLRVGLRRLRAALVLFSKPAGGEAADRLASEARWLGGMVGTQRDLDVAADLLVGPAIAASGPGAPPDEVLRRIGARAAANRPDLRDTLAGLRAKRFALDLARFAETAPWDAMKTPARQVATAALGKSWRRAERRAQGIATLNLDERHDLRKALKRVRYQTEFAAPLYDPAAVEAFLGPLKAVQDAFGALNDIAMLETLLRGDDGPGDAGVLRDLLALRQADAPDLWAQAQTLWAELDRAPRFWQAG